MGTLPRRHTYDDQFQILPCGECTTPFVDSLAPSDADDVARAESLSASHHTSCSISTSFPGAPASFKPRARYRVPGCRLDLFPKMHRLNNLPFESRNSRDSTNPCINVGHTPGIPVARNGAESAPFHTHSRSGFSNPPSPPPYANGLDTSCVSQ